MIESFIRAVLEEDIGRGDLFERVGKSRPAAAHILAKSMGVLAGEPYIAEIGRQLNLQMEWQMHDGDPFAPGDILLHLRGESFDLLAVERSILNIMLHASSIATHVSHYVKMLKKHNVKLLDTRKTRPLLRNFEKYAVRIGGAVNHRMGLDDALMLKDTHLETIVDLKGFITEARKKIPFTSKIEIESESVEDAIRAMDAGADIVMCDNMVFERIKEVVAYRNKHYPHVMLEVSGNITIENLEYVAAAGVDAISSGSIIHQSRWLDLSMKMEHEVHALINGR